MDVHYKVKYISSAKIEFFLPPNTEYSACWVFENTGKHSLPVNSRFVCIKVKGYHGAEYKHGAGGGNGIEEYILKDGLGVGERKEISIQLRSPSENCKHKLFWAILSPEGVKIGKRDKGQKRGVGREELREDKRAAREDRKRIRIEEREERKIAKEASKTAKAQFVWPDNVTHLFLDGNNMLFVPSKLRSLMISRSKHKAEQILEAFTIAFSELTSIPSVTLVFDHSSMTDKLKNLSGERIVHVKSAHRAGFSTSDDALVDWVGKIKQQDASAVVLCITSDRGLTERLAEWDSKVAKPGQWFAHARNVMMEATMHDANPSASEGGNFDEFFDIWVANNFA